MDSRHGKIRMNVEGDRLSNLPDDLIHKILSFLDIREAIQTSALSSRWRHTWTSLRCLNFSSSTYFRTLLQFAKFVKHVLANRNNQIEVSFVKLHFRGKVSQVFVKKILEYASSHNVQQMDISCLPEKKTEFPLSLFCSQSLKHLTLYGWIREYVNVTPPTWELQALTTLNLHRVTLNDDSTDKRVGFISNFTTLKNLTIRECRLVGLNGFNICHPGLSSLTLEDRCYGVNVDTPQLKNLAIKDCSGIHLISAPKLSSLKYEDYSHPLDLPADLLLNVDICISCASSSSEGKATAHKIVCMLQQLRSVQFLALNSELIKLLSSSIEIIANQPSPFANLKSLKIYPAYTPDELMQPRVSRKKAKLMQSKVTMSTEVRNWLLNSSPGATFTMVSHEEIRAVKNVISARNLTTQLEDKLKNFTKTYMTNIKQGKAPMATVRKQVEDLKCTVLLLPSINALLEKLPASHQYKLVARLSGLYAEVQTIMNYMEDWVQIQCDKKVHEPATSSQPSS